jgi:hypothetical protein
MESRLFKLARTRKIEHKRRNPRLGAIRIRFGYAEMRMLSMTPLANNAAYSAAIAFNNV